VSNDARSGMSAKLYILDTNVLIYDPSSMFQFKQATVCIPVTVLEELEKFKGETTERGRNTREVIRFLDSLRERGELNKGVKLDNGGILRIVFLPEVQLLPHELKEEVPDNKIILTALVLKDQGHQVRFISKDISARVKADVLGIEAVDYKKGVPEEKFYKGWREYSVPASVLKKDFPKQLEEIAQEKLSLNEFVWLKSKNNPYNYRVFRYVGNHSFRSVHKPHFKWKLEPHNAQQLMALDLLLDPSIEFVSLVGAAGTGKTFLALLAGLHQVLVQDDYERILISRPVVPLGQDIGYLPGDIQEKLRSWMQPMYDNMDLIMHTAAQGIPQYTVEDHDKKIKKKAKKGKPNNKENQSFKLRSLDDLIKHNKISLEAITYMRGRSIPFQFIIIDEVQNLNPHEVKTLITRVGQGSKIIVTGDPYQIDSPYLDFSSNGLVVASNKFKGQRLFGSVYLSVSERSELSRLANELL
jgi:PhoH-like ATPase